MYNPSMLFRNVWGIYTMFILSSSTYIGLHMCACACRCLYVQVCVHVWVFIYHVCVYVYGYFVILLLNEYSINDPMYLKLPPLCFLLSAKSKSLIISITTLFNPNGSPNNFRSLFESL